mmetsp:Transcript_8020/g.22126  ORF Transcript_8020/g.22126 Transcript_8020/m.22126 type:complete len:349 (-) Transcript_8020:2128-3174(-)
MHEVNHRGANSAANPPVAWRTRIEGCLPRSSSSKCSGGHLQNESSAGGALVLDLILNGYSWQTELLLKMDSDEAGITSSHGVFEVRTHLSVRTYHGTRWLGIPWVDVEVHLREQTCHHVFRPTLNQRNLGKGCVTRFALCSFRHISILHHHSERLLSGGHQLCELPTPTAHLFAQIPAFALAPRESTAQLLCVRLGGGGPPPRHLDWLIAHWTATKVAQGGLHTTFANGTTTTYQPNGVQQRLVAEIALDLRVFALSLFLGSLLLTAFTLQAILLVFLGAAIFEERFWRTANPQHSRGTLRVCALTKALHQDLHAWRPDLAHATRLHVLIVDRVCASIQNRTPHVPCH